MLLCVLGRRVAFGKQPEDLPLRTKGLYHGEPREAVAQRGDKAVVFVGDVFFRDGKPVARKQRCKQGQNRKTGRREREQRAVKEHHR